MKDGKPVGAEPDIAVQLLSLHVAYAHSETDLEFLSFLLLEKMLCALPRPTPTRLTGTHTAPSNQPWQHVGARVEVEKQSPSSHPACLRRSRGVLEYHYAVSSVSS